MMPMSPRERYQADVSAGRILFDAGQAEVVEQTENLYRVMLETQGGRRFWKRSEGLRGVYIWGDVGGGKTYIMDNLFLSLPGDRKWRDHFHSFMRGIHKALARHKGRKDPLQRVARETVDQVDTIFLDEFQVSDIVDAMLLYGLLSTLSRLGVMVVMTSNIPPRDLYKNGLQRERFLPAIDLIETQMQVIELKSARDFRTIVDGGSHIRWLVHGADEYLATFVERYFEDLDVGRTYLSVNNRQIPVRVAGRRAAWFDFAALCATPRSSGDYVEISRRYDLILLSGVMVMGVYQDDVAIRFMHLIDALYDQGVRLVVTASAKPDEIYIGHTLALSFKRTVSRLIEMQSDQYFALS